jgi:hypothetical protein
MSDEVLRVLVWRVRGIPIKLGAHDGVEVFFVRKDSVSKRSSHVY